MIPLTWRFVFVAMLVRALWPSATSAQTLLDEHFTAPDVIGKAGSATAAWTSSVDGAGSVSAGDNGLVLLATGSEWANANLLGAARSDLLFFDRPITLTVSGLGIVSSHSPADQQRARIAVASESKSPYQARSAVGLVVYADGYFAFGYKINTPPDAPNDPENVNQLVAGKLPGPVRNVSLTIDGDQYTLSIDHESAGGGALTTATYTGKFSDKGPGLTKAAWGDSAAIVVQGQKAQGANENKVTVTLKRITVTAAK
jgi:hypothetical protein